MICFYSWIRPARLNSAAVTVKSLRCFPDSGDQRKRTCSPAGASGSWTLTACLGIVSMLELMISQRCRAACGASSARVLLSHPLKVLCLQLMGSYWSLDACSTLGSLNDGAVSHWSVLLKEAVWRPLLLSSMKNRK